MTWLSYSSSMTDAVSHPQNGHGGASISRHPTLLGSWPLLSMIIAIHSLAITTRCTTKSTTIFKKRPNSLGITGRNDTLHESFLHDVQLVWGQVDARLASCLDWGSKGRRFESSHPDCFNVMFLGNLRQSTLYPTVARCTTKSTTVGPKRLLPRLRFDLANSVP